MDGNDGEEKRGRDTHEDHKMRTFQSQVDSMQHVTKWQETGLSPENSETVKTDALICTDNWTLR